MKINWTLIGEDLLKTKKKIRPAMAEFLKAYREEVDALYPPLEETTVGEARSLWETSIEPVKAEIKKYVETLMGMEGFRGIEVESLSLIGKASREDLAGKTPTRDLDIQVLFSSTGDLQEDPCGKLIPSMEAIHFLLVSTNLSLYLRKLLKTQVLIDPILLNRDWKRFQVKESLNSKAKDTRKTTAFRVNHLFRKLVRLEGEGALGWSKDCLEYFLLQYKLGYLLWKEELQLRKKLKG